MLMQGVSKRTQLSILRDYRVEYNLEIRWLDLNGRVDLAEKQTNPLENLPAFRRIRTHALKECVRWGEPQAFFIAPGIMSWIAPLVDRFELRGGLMGGYVFVEEDPQAISVAINYLVSEGADRKEAQAFAKSIPLFDQSHIRTAADFLFSTFYQYSGWEPRLLRQNRDQMQQQRQIAEEIHHRKVQENRAYPYDEERILLSLIRVGDRAGARRIFNKMLAAMFLYAPKQVVLRARAIEMMGYLVRAAVEDSPMMEPLLERHMEWIVQIIETEDFDDLCHVLAAALDDFMESIFRQGAAPVPLAVQKALDFIAENYTEPIRLEEIANAVGLSTFRIAHLLKETTGKTALQNIHYLRVQEACRLLEESNLSCTDIAYETGFGDQSYFIKQFRKWMGVTPAKYRRSRQLGKA
jgi:AraC-like DNA-binding protein